MKFTTAEIITAGIGRMCVANIGRIYAIFNHLTSDDLFTHQLPRAFKTYKEHLHQTFPWLNELKEDDFGPENYKASLEAVVSKYGNEHELEPAPNLWVIQEPMQELVDMVGKEKVISVQL